MSLLTIEPLTWDSEHLGIACGRLSFTAISPSTDQIILKKEMLRLLEKSPEKLIVSKIPSDFHNLLGPLGEESVFIDSEITFRYVPHGTPQDFQKKHPVTFSKSCDPTHFERLATEMIYSRYYIDPTISDSKAKTMWIDSIRNHCQGRADGIATIYINKNPAGIIIIEEKEHKVINLAIVGILKEFQGSGVGTALLQQVIQRYAPNKTILVEASVRNKRAIQFYQQNGFILDSMTYVTHHWQHEHAMLRSLT